MSKVFWCWHIWNIPLGGDRFLLSQRYWWWILARKRNGSAFVCFPKLLQLQILLHFDHLAPKLCSKRLFFFNLQGTLRHNPLKRLMTLITDYSKVNSNNQSRNKFLTLRWQILQRGDILMTACWQQFDGKSFTVQWQIKTIPNSQSKSMLP